MAAPTITDLPEVPPTNDADFETKAPALFNAIKNTFVGEVNDFGDYLNTVDWLTLALGLSSNKLTYSNGSGDVVVAPELHWDSVNKRLGIGASSPSHKLNVLNGAIRVDRGAASESLILAGSGSNFQVVHDGTSLVKLFNSGGGFNFSTSVISHAISILGSGNVGINTALPSTTLDVNGPIKCKSYTVATVPSASSSGAGAQIYVTDETGGAVPCFSDGTNWRRVSDRAIIS